MVAEPTNPGATAQSTARKEGETSNRIFMDWLPKTVDGTAKFQDKAGPSVRIPQILNFLQDEDKDRFMGWETRITDIKQYLDYADELRKSGDRVFDPYLTADLLDARILVDVHKNFENWNYGPSHWSTYVLNKTHNPVRLHQYPDQPPRWIMAQKRDLPLRKVTHLVPRVHDLEQSPFFHRPTPDGDPKWDRFFQTPEGSRLMRILTVYHEHDTDAWEGRSGHKTNMEEVRKQDRYKCPENPSGMNYSELENNIYEKMTEGDITSLRQIPDPEPEANGGIVQFAMSRGYKRAAFQRVINMMNNSENRELNTPWRRVAFQLPAKRHTDVVYRPRALVREGDPRLSKDPSPWIYWYNQYLEQRNYLSAWSRKAFHKEKWMDTKQVSLPSNFQGPYFFSGRPVYDNYWLRLENEFVLLTKKLQKTSGMFAVGARPLLEAVARDLAAGFAGEPWPADLPPRLSRDTIRGQNNGDAYQLVDERDADWLRYLCTPGTSMALLNTEILASDNLLILFDNRLQTLLNDPYNNMFWVQNTANEREDGVAWEREWIALETLLPIINRVPENPDHIAIQQNHLYQFTMEEAIKFSKYLGKVGRIKFHPYPCVSVPDWEIYPEHLVVWRHASQEALEEFNEQSASDWAAVIISEVPSPRARFRKMAEEAMPRFKREIFFKLGTYDDECMEYLRHAPAFEDLLSWRVGLKIKAQSSVPERTSQFFRNLAYRLGRTMLHIQTLKDRFSYARSSRAELDIALDDWKRRVEQGIMIESQKGASPFIPGGLKDVVHEVSPQHTDIDGNEQKLFQVIREGIIDDMVQNRTMLYPSRLTAWSDGLDDILNPWTGDSYVRENVWSWAREPIRRYHSKYTREKYFDMTRWPLERQTEARRREIENRQDEIQRIWPARQRYGITPATDLPPKYATKPSDRSSAKSTTAHIDSTSSVSEEDSEDNDDDRSSDYNVLIKGLCADDRCRRGNGPHPVTKNIPGHHPKMPTGKAIEIVNGGPRDDLGIPIPPRPEPMRRKTEIFIPGPAVFPMGDTLLQQVQFSKELENLLYPQRTASWPNRIAAHLAAWFKGPPDRVPLLPDIDLARAPVSNPKKRKLPSQFIKPVVEPRKAETEGERQLKRRAVATPKFGRPPRATPAPSAAPAKPAAPAVPIIPIVPVIPKSTQGKSRRPPAAVPPVTPPLGSKPTSLPTPPSTGPRGLSRIGPMGGTRQSPKVSE